jgi:pyruvate/2-oxoglutarate dehydrogenase complex dihydrolipoamide dehydrogenase (E3) component
MSVDYDLVILGSSPAGIHAALRATQFHARVALIDQGVALMGCLPSFWAAPAPIAQWYAALTADLTAQYAPSVLATHGIDVIAGCGEFVRQPQFGVVVGRRSLRSRAYLLATGTRPLIPDISGIDTVSYFTIDTIAPQLDKFTPDQRVVVLGDEPMGLAIAQALVRQQVQVTLIVATATVLPEGDGEAVGWLQAHLEADGMTLLTATAVTQVRQLGDQIWVQAGDQAIAADALLLAPRQTPNLQGLNLEAAYGPKPVLDLAVNAKMQTRHPRIYACFGQWQQHYLDHYAIQQAAIAVDNALFWPVKTVNQRAISYLVPTTPELLSIGLSEEQARQRYGEDVMILQQPFSTLAKVQWQGAPTGFCKLLVRRRGEIVGAQIAGPQAGELGAAIALAMQQNLSVQTLATLGLPSLACTQLIAATAQEWQRLRRLDSPWRRDWLEEVLSWLRSWS